MATSAADNVRNSMWYPLIVYPALSQNIIAYDTFGAFDWHRDEAYHFKFLPEMDSSFSIIDILEDEVVREDAKGTEPETEEE